MKRLLLGAVAGAALTYYRLFGGPLEGTAWEIKLKADSIFSFSHKDTLIFDRGQLKASGFSSASYDAKRVGGEVDAIWNASMTSAERGTMTWHGLVKGDKIEGVAVLWTKDGKQKRFSFSGKRA